MDHHVTDFLSNTNEHIAEAAKAIKHSEAAREVFDAIHTGKRAVKTVPELAAQTGLTEKVVLTHGKKFVDLHLIRQERVNGRTAYRKNGALQKKKRQIFSLAKSSAKLAALPTKRNVAVRLPKAVSIPAAWARVHRIHIDDVASFSKVKQVKGNDSMPENVSEDEFKRGIQSILGEPGKFKDWGGEKSDLYTSRLLLNGKRRAAAFAFKGPGLKGKLTLAKMGKNGDQLLRLLQEEADVFFVQHWREIDPNVISAFHLFAIANSVTKNKQIWYGIIDGKDSHRLYLAYPENFSSNARTKKKHI